MPKWDAETDAKLLTAIVKAADAKFDMKAIAVLMSTSGDECTVKALTHRMARIKAEGKALWPDDSSVPATPAAPKTPGSRKRKTVAKTPAGEDEVDTSASVIKKRKVNAAVKKESTPDSSGDGKKTVEIAEAALTNESEMAADNGLASGANAAALEDAVMHVASTPFCTPMPATPRSDIVTIDPEVEEADAQVPITPSAGLKKGTTKKGRATTKKAFATPSGESPATEEPSTPATAKKAPAARKSKAKATTPKTIATNGTDEESGVTKTTTSKKGKGTAKPRGRPPKSAPKVTPSPDPESKEDTIKVDTAETECITVTMKDIEGYSEPEKVERNDDDDETAEKPS